MNIFIHHKDLRLHDNTTFIKMINTLDDSDKIIPIFIFPAEQIDPKKNKYFSNNFVQFMCQTLIDLSEQYKSFNGKLLFFEGNYIDILENIKKYFNKKNRCVHN